MNGITVSPAYGRDYKSAQAARDAWTRSDDFVQESIGPDMGRYVNCDDLPDGTRVTIRYKHMTRVTVVENQAP